MSEFLGPQTKLAELHVHLGSSVDPAVMWGIANAQGIKLPTKDYWKFVELITVNPSKVKSFKDYLKMFKWTESIQSSPLAVERSVYETIAGAYRKNNITLLELRFNPMKRNRGGEQDLDHIMMAAIRGLDRASLEYPVKAGIIICLDRTFNLRLNEILLEKALRYMNRGIVGIDIAGSTNRSFKYSQYRSIYRRARKEGLGLTVHAGEDEGHQSVRQVIEQLDPDRIGHGVRACEDRDTLELVRKRAITLEVCPSSNLQTKVVKGVGQMKQVFKAFKESRVKYTINTDGPEMLMTNLRNEVDFLLRNGILTVGDVLQANKNAFKASFLRN
ncbi:MAG: adenosine deaminase [Thaumarchaeota archaeon]|nr:adenosine deaminase [Nitrososphaerota archaeon]MCS4540263.1 adenosine deaminase [Nitrososphaerota archaeon]